MELKRWKEITPDWFRGCFKFESVQVVNSYTVQPDKSLFHLRAFDEQMNADGGLGITVQVGYSTVAISGVRITPVQLHYNSKQRVEQLSLRVTL